MFNPSLHSVFPIHFNGLVPRAIHICLWSTPGSIKMLFSKVQNSTFVLTSCKPGAGSIRCVGFAVYICNSSITPDFESTRTAGSSFPARTLMSFANRIDACSFCSCSGAFKENIGLSLASVPVLDLAIDAQCRGTTFCYMENIPLMHLLIYVVPIKTLWAAF